MRQNEGHLFFKMPFWLPLKAVFSHRFLGTSPKIEQLSKIGHFSAFVSAKLSYCWI